MSETDHNVARLLLRIEHAIYEGAEAVDRDERAQIMAAIREVLASERVIDPPAVRLSGAERQRLGRADRIDFDTLCRAVEDIITEHVGGIPVIPTGPFRWADGAADVNTPLVVATIGCGCDCRRPGFGMTVSHVAPCCYPVQSPASPAGGESDD